METLSRMIPFTREVFLGLFTQYNEAIWPVPLVAGLLGILMVGAAFRPFPGSDRIVSLMLATIWIWTGVVYHMLYFAPINWTAWAFGFFFVIQGLAFLVAGTLRGRIAYRAAGGVAGWCGGLLIVAALFIYPLAAGLTDQAWPGIALFGVAPCPTVLFTLGLLLWAAPRVPWRLLTIPALWAIVGGSAALVLAIPQDAALPVAALLTIVLALRKNVLSRSSAA